MFDTDSEDNASTCSSPAVLDWAVVLEHARAADRRPYPMVRSHLRLLPLGALHEDPREDIAENGEDDDNSDADTVHDGDYDNDENRSFTHDFFAARSGSDFGAESPCFSFASSSSSSHFVFASSPQLRAPPPPRPSTALAAYSTPSPTSSAGSSVDQTASISAPLIVPKVPMPRPTVLPLQPIITQHQQPASAPVWQTSISFPDAPSPAAPQVTEPPSPTNNTQHKQKPSILTKLSFLASTVSGAPKTPPRSPQTASPVPRRSATSMDRPYFRAHRRFRQDVVGTPDSSRPPSSASLTYAGSAYSPSPRQSGLLSASISSDNLKAPGSLRREGGSGSIKSTGGRVAVFLEKLKNFQKRKDGIARRAGGGGLTHARNGTGGKGWDVAVEFGEQALDRYDSSAVQKKNKQPQTGELSSQTRRSIILIAAYTKAEEKSAGSMTLAALKAIVLSANPVHLMRHPSSDRDISHGGRRGKSSERRRDHCSRPAERSGVKSKGNSCSSEISESSSSNSTDVDSHSNLPAKYETGSTYSAKSDYSGAYRLPAAKPPKSAWRFSIRKATVVLNIEASTDTEFMTRFEMRKSNEHVMIQEAADVKAGELKVRAYTVQLAGFVRELAREYATALCFTRSFPDEHEFIGSVKEIKSGSISASIQVHPHACNDYLVGALHLVQSDPAEQSKGAHEHDAEEKHAENEKRKSPKNADRSRSRHGNRHSSRECSESEFSYDEVPAHKKGLSPRAKNRPCETPCSDAESSCGEVRTRGKHRKSRGSSRSNSSNSDSNKHRGRDVCRSEKGVRSRSLSQTKKHSRHSSERIGSAKSKRKASNPGRHDRDSETESSSRRSSSDRHMSESSKWPGGFDEQTSKLSHTRNRSESRNRSQLRAHSRDSSDRSHLSRKHRKAQSTSSEDSDHKAAHDKRQMDENSEKRSSFCRSCGNGKQSSWVPKNQSKSRSRDREHNEERRKGFNTDKDREFPDNIPKKSGSKKTSKHKHNRNSDSDSDHHSRSYERGRSPQKEKKSLSNRERSESYNRGRTVARSRSTDKSPTKKHHKRADTKSQETNREKRSSSFPQSDHSARAGSNSRIHNTSRELDGKKPCSPKNRSSSQNRSRNSSTDVSHHKLSGKHAADYQSSGSDSNHRREKDHENRRLHSRTRYPRAPKESKSPQPQRRKSGHVADHSSIGFSDEELDKYFIFTNPRTVFVPKHEGHKHSKHFELHLDFPSDSHSSQSSEERWKDKKVFFKKDDSPLTSPTLSSSYASSHTSSKRTSGSDSSSPPSWSASEESDLSAAASSAESVHYDNRPKIHSNAQWISERLKQHEMESIGSDNHSRSSTETRDDASTPRARSPRDQSNDRKKHVEAIKSVARFQASNPGSGEIISPRGIPPEKGDLPSQELVLNFVHGYRTRDVSNNAFFLTENLVVFPAGSVGVVMDLKTRTQRFFHGRHRQEISTLSLHPSRRLVATGDTVNFDADGDGAFLYVWDPYSPEDVQRQVQILVGDKKLAKGIVDAQFSGCGKYIAAVSMDEQHHVYLYNWQKAGKLLAAEKAGHHSVFGLVFNWHNSSATEFVTFGAKHVTFWSFDAATSRLVATTGTFPHAPNAHHTETFSIVSCAHLADGRLVSGTHRGVLLIWDSGARGTVQRVVEAVHRGPVFALRVDPVRGGLVTGGGDGHVTRVNTQTWDIIARLELPAGVRAVDICPTRGALLVGMEGSELIEVNEFAKSGVLQRGAYKMHICGHSVSNVVRTRHTVAKTRLQGKLRAVAYSPDGKYLAVGNENGDIFILKSNDLVQAHYQKYEKHEDVKSKFHAIHALKFSPNGRFLAVGTSDNIIYIWELHSGFKISAMLKVNIVVSGIAILNVQQGHASAITHLDWSKTSEHLRSNSSTELLHWALPNGFLVKDASKLVWATNTCTWQESILRGEVNAVDECSDHSCIATCDDYSNIKLYSSKCQSKAMIPFKRYSGHGSAVTNIAFNANGGHMVSIGGTDGCTFEWTVEKTL
ncbi:Echinoderm microtubule-associated protein-like 5 [Entophlyctis sp. JEL0112]|nr:Echinoderm microtubule-associated protein-like 5 [Entophlyctis sp. JEL0112]